MQPWGPGLRYRWFVTRLSLWADKHLNFYRVHLMAYTLIPAISASIFYASNGRTKISYLDSLFMCTSAMTSSGLNTINLSTTTVWQQVILAILMFIGNSTSVSLVVLLVRRSYFKSKCEDVVRMARQQQQERDLIKQAVDASGGTGMFGRMRTRAQTLFGRDHTTANHPKPEAREDGLGVPSQTTALESTQRRIIGRVRGGTIVTSIASDDTHINLGGDGKSNVDAWTKVTASEDVGASSGSSGQGHPETGDANGPATAAIVPPKLTRTAPTPSGTMNVFSDMGTSESPADETHPHLVRTDTPSPVEPDFTSTSGNNPAGGKLKHRPQSLALGHESDRTAKKLRQRAGGIRVGDREVLESNLPESRPQYNEENKPQDDQASDNRRSFGERASHEGASAEESGQDVVVQTSSPTTMSKPESPNANTQFVISNLSPKSGTFASSPNAMSERVHTPSSAKFKIPRNPERLGGARLSPIDPTRPNNPNRSSLEHQPPSPLRNSELFAPPRKTKISTSSRGTAPSPVRPVFLHPPNVVPRARRTTFVDSVHSIHPQGHGRDRASTLSNESGHAQSQRTMHRGRNGTITTPSMPYSHLPPHAEGNASTDGIDSRPAGQGDKLANESVYSHPSHAHASQAHSSYQHRPRAQTGQGGLPNPLELIAQLGVDYLPGVRKFLGEHEREVVNETEGRGRKGSIHVRTDTGSHSGGAGNAPGIADDDISLDEEDLMKMGGDEYNALVVLSWIVAGHYLLHHAIAFTILAPYSAKVSLVRDVIEAQDKSSGRKLNTTWFALFTVISAYANAGLTVVDTSLTQMSSAYVMIFVIIWLILVGATAFPLSLRFSVWVGTKIFRRGSTARGLRFLLRHPRRCFMYLFPSHQSWYLLFTLVVIFILDWVAYLTFNIGMPGIDSVPTGPRVVGGFLQAVGQRAGGFTTINLQAIAPALQVVYIATMFVQVYPIAMAVRTSNVYEDSGVVIYHEETDDEEPTDLPAGRGAGFTAYLGWHLKHQLAKDLFWLIAALTTLCAFERKRILSEETAYFNIFSLFFEIVSAFANVGFSLGVSSQPFSLSGEMRTIPRLVIIGLMIRGRHRGLPMAIDRAVQLPPEYKTTSLVAGPSGVSSRRSTIGRASRRPTVGTWTRTSVRQRQRAQDPTLDSDEE